MLKRFGYTTRSSCKKGWLCSSLTVYPFFQFYVDRGGLSLLTSVSAEVDNELLALQKQTSVPP